MGDAPAATAIPDRFLHHAEIIRMTGKSYRLRNQASQLKEHVAPEKAIKASSEQSLERKESLEGTCKEPGN